MQSPARTIQSPLETEWQRKWLAMDVTHPRVQEIARDIQHYCLALLENRPAKRQLVLVGESGSGKSHIALRIGSWLRRVAMFAWECGHWPRPPGSMYARWPEIVEGFRNHEFGAVQDMIDADFLVLDDIGAENDPFKSACDKLCQVLTRRDGKWTLATTNIVPDEWANRFDSRVADRLLRNAQVITFAGVPSYAVATFGRAI